MPNLTKFGEDPAAMLVMALEHYDESTGKAAKAAIVSKEVVGQIPDPEGLRSRGIEHFDAWRRRSARSSSCQPQHRRDQVSYFAIVSRNLSTRCQHRWYANLNWQT